MVRNEIEVDVVCSALDMIADLLKTCKQGITNIPGHCEEVIQVPYLTTLLNILQILLEILWKNRLFRKIKVLLTLKRKNFVEKTVKTLEIIILF